MKGKSIEVVVELGGDSRIDAVGFQGADCKQATACLEKALGIVKASSKKGEYYAAVGTRERQRLGH